MADPQTPPVGERSLGDLVGAVASDLSTLVRDEVALARTELTAEVQRVGQGAGMLGGAAVAALMLLGTASATAVIALDEAMPLWAAALVVTAVWAVVAAALALQGRRRLAAGTDPLPRTRETLQEDVTWARARKS